MTNQYAYLFPVPGTVDLYPPYALPGLDLNCLHLTQNGVRRLTCFEWTHTTKSKRIANRTWTQTRCFADYSVPDTARVVIDTTEDKVRYTRSYQLDKGGYVVEMQRNQVPLDDTKDFSIGKPMPLSSGYYRLGLNVGDFRPLFVPAQGLIKGPSQR